MTTITHPQLVAALVKSPDSIQAELNIYAIDLWHGATGVAGEGGELLEAILFPPEAGVDRVNLREELGDLFFYMEQIVQRSGVFMDWDTADLMARNAIISPDTALANAAAVAVHSSQVLDTIKKLALYNKSIDMEMLSNQMNTLAAAALTVGYQFGVSREDALNANIAKLSKRYESLSYSDAQAQARADKVQPQEGVVPERRYFKGEDLDLPPEVSGVTQPLPRTSDMDEQVQATKGS